MTNLNNNNQYLNISSQSLTNIDLTLDDYTIYGLMKPSFKSNIDLKLSLNYAHLTKNYIQLFKSIKKLKKHNFNVIVLLHTPAHKSLTNSWMTAIHIACINNIKNIYIYNDESDQSKLNNEIIESELNEYHKRICNKLDVKIIFKNIIDHNISYINNIYNDFKNDKVLIISDYIIEQIKKYILNESEFMIFKVKNNIFEPIFNNN
jgi:hypothetical protein